MAGFPHLSTADSGRSSEPPDDILVILYATAGQSQPWRGLQSLFPVTLEQLSC
jgi:hypothetical protein